MQPQKKPINKRKFVKSPLKKKGETGAVTKKRPTTGSKGGRKRGSQNRQVSIDQNQHGREVLIKDSDGDWIK